MKFTLQKLVFSLLFCIAFFTVKAGKVYDFNATCQQAYKEITSLRLENGERLIAQAKAENPDNLIPYFLNSYIDFFILFFNEDPAELKIREPHFDDYVDILDEGPSSSPFYNYCRAVVLIQAACVEIKFGERWSAGWDFRKAFGLIKDNRKKFPGFVPNNMLYGPMQVVAGTIPDGYKWIAGLFGIKGSISKGMTLMQGVINSNDSYARLFANEAAFYYCYVSFYIQNQPEKVFQFIRQKNFDLVNNHLMAYMAANLAVNNKMNEFARDVIENRNRSSAYMQTPVWNFELAYVQMRHLELEDAAKNFEYFLSHFKGKFYVKDACEKLAWCYYLMGNTAAANNARQMVLKRGNTDTDADKEANKNAKAGKWPTPLLLKARVLNDGGYNQQAISLLRSKSANDFTDATDKLEYTYRTGRIYDDMNYDDSAVKYYQAAISLGINRTEYYASRAALQIGMIYEKQGNKQLAIQYYQKCLAMQNHDYKDSMDQKAKSGIARCSGG
ncbi:tetratricopeptide repeat protein [Parafilimonas terrae]|uniref:Tetratricopeptide repeat-containing protein n=1 Tax=Parafilimonas terrae TaxID=1465490 RepID=A0A1I5SIC0_9BACT|nr:tetratricopeptide repeat protein [Parafilimonas terrae]SFP70247.1 Tetratricopeptide repeat-containing protein [Parafilimonas terrae]